MGMSGMSALGGETDAAGASGQSIPLEDWPAPAGVIPPGANTKLAFDVLTCPDFADGNWHPTFLAQAVLAEFSASGWQSARDIDPKDFPRSPQAIERELAQLLALRDLRRVRLAEIVAQSEDATPYWANMLLCGPAIRPATWTLLLIGQTVGLMVAMHFKYKYKRARPAQVYPALMPPIITPPHPSYPNAHALQSLLMSECAAQACPALREPLIALAARVGENREIAGVHFPSDREASKQIAAAVMPMLLRAEALTFQRVLARAKQEWSGVAA